MQAAIAYYRRVKKDFRLCGNHHYLMLHKGESYILESKCCSVELHEPLIRHSGCLP